MIAHDPLIQRHLNADTIVAYNLSGGKDCGAAAAEVDEYLDGIDHPRANRIALHSNLGRAEWEFTPAQVEAQAHALGVRLVVVEAGSGDLVDRFENRWERGLELYRDLRLYNLRGPWSSPSLKFCQSEKKIQVMGPHLARTYRGRTIINVVGIRREESTARAKAEVAKLDTRFAKPGNRAGTTMLLWHPIVDVLHDEVFDINRRHGIPLAQSYDRGSTRHSCALCVMGSLNDLSVGADGHPWLHRHYVGMEATSTFSFQAGRWLGDIRPDLLSAELLDRLARAKQFAIERRRIEAGLPARHRFVNGWPLFVPTYDEAQQIVDGRRAILAQHGFEDIYYSPQLVIDRFEELVALSAMKRAA